MVVKYQSCFAAGLCCFHLQGIVLTLSWQGTMFNHTLDVFPMVTTFSCGFFLTTNSFHVTSRTLIAVIRPTTMYIRSITKIVL